MADSETKRGRGRPRKQVAAPPKKRGRPPGSTSKRSRTKKINFNDRKQVERYTSSMLGGAADDLDSLRASLKRRIDSLEKQIDQQVKSGGTADLELEKLLDAAQAKLARICDKQISLCDTLIKRFDLLNELGAGEDDEGTPVEVNYDDGAAREALSASP